MKKNFAECVVFTALLTMAMTVVGSCKDDDTEITDPGTDAVTVDSTLLQSDEQVYKYIMSQFVELNVNGTLSERTRFYRQLNEADSTDLYAHTKTKADARRLFLQLLPSENAKLVKANKDSSEMSYAFSNGLRSLTYSESKSGNVVATVILPSEGNYQKYVNSLTMVKTFGTNAGGTYYIKDVLGIYREFEIPMYFSNRPSWYYDTENNTCVQSPVWGQKDYQIQIRKKKVHMHCFYVDTYSDQAYFAFVAPCSASHDLTDSENNEYPYLVQHFQPYFLNPLNAEKDVNYFVNADEFKDEDVLPSVDQLRTFFYAFTDTVEVTYNIRSYYQGVTMFYTFLNNIDSIITDTLFLEDLGGSEDNNILDVRFLDDKDEESLRNKGLGDAYDLFDSYRRWLTCIDPSSFFAEYTASMQKYQERFMYYPADKWKISNNNIGSVLVTPHTNNISYLSCDDQNWFNKYDGKNYDLLMSFASKDYVGKGIKDGAWDESDYFFASQCTYQNSVTGKQDTARFNEQNNQWTLIKEMSGDTVYQKYVTFEDLDAKETLFKSSKQVVLRGREVRNPTPLRIVYIKKVKISDLGIQGVGATHDEDDIDYTKSNINYYLDTYKTIKNLIADWKNQKLDRGVVY